MSKILLIYPCTPIPRSGGSGRVICKRRLVMDCLGVSKSVSFGHDLFALVYEMPDQTRLCFEPIKTPSSV